MLGLSRHTKRHRLYRFEQLGILRVQERQTGRAMRGDPVSKARRKEQSA
jgi:hypothetical protein